jgi:hypothetical protein
MIRQLEVYVCEVLAWLAVGRSVPWESRETRSWLAHKGDGCMTSIYQKQLHGTGVLRPLYALSLALALLHVVSGLL